MSGPHSGREGNSSAICPDVGTYHASHAAFLGGDHAVAAIRPVLVLIGAIFAALSLAATVAQAAWPERPVTVVVPFTPGGITDVLARLMAERLREALKEPFIVENAPPRRRDSRGARPQSGADGYTLLFTPIFQITMAPYTAPGDVRPGQGFQADHGRRDEPVHRHRGRPDTGDTLAAFITYVKTEPGQMTYGSAGTGSLSHVTAALFLKSAGLDMIHVPYRGLGAAFTDLLAGHVAMVSATPNRELKSYLNSGKIRPFAVTAATRTKQLPDVPTVGETLPNPPSITLNGLVAPGRTPQEIVDTLARETVAAEKSADFQDRLVSVGVDPIVATPAEFAEIIAEDTERWRDVVRELNLKPR